ncbi:LEAF RUST 10 DISEASE-RESISTANCE LOCUS RECEPTOR-LIKE PROTEIN KINASE-like 2.5 isoform X1 [Salvia splendens]|uniref:LEAF RUST 10 DISEASE-RESISTANCE LOCUS RECEPTOR-LIKE PROTEIN KINASE-like 2.5 isoform X1 n=2 Tax=Salvia splendens TaxID=180675 RepID=UPI001C27B5C3|nr:LEAF RUST 10 DISEASE-RESISTANCE LOCUS RECEPTOR-LIKE PROTEIN KINASE-like 2.5 isoform X1 [Salvia splendens]
MSNQTLFSSYLALLILLLCFTESCRARNSSHCITSSCRNINISYPFRLRSDPANCGHPDSIFALECQKDRLTLHMNSRRYHVEAITYSNFSIRISDPGLDSKNISFCPIYSYVDNVYMYSSYVYTYYPSSIYITYINCQSPVVNPLYVENPYCANTSAFSNTSRIYSYVTAERISVPDLEASCTFDTVTQVSVIWPSTDHHNYSYAQIHDLLAYGFELSWFRLLCIECDESNGECSSESNEIRCRHYCYESTPFEDLTLICKLEYYAVYLYFPALAIGGLIVLRYVVGIPCLLGMVVIRRKRQRSWINNSENIEELTIHQLNHMPINYSYREIKKMTHNFKAKLGGGPHGTVFRGKLRSSPIAAVKMQTSSSSSSASDKEFMRHASEISRITNANMVKLFGFCIIKGNKRALVHEFVQCGSLDKHISLQTRSELWRDVEDSCGDSPWDPGFACC